MKIIYIFDEKFLLIATFVQSVPRIVAYILSSVIFLSLSLNTLILAYFEYNYDYIVSELCIEKDVKESCCKGSCHLNQEFDKMQTSKEDTQVNFINSTESLNWIVVTLKTSTDESFFLRSEPGWSSDYSLSNGHNSLIEHSPAA